MSRQQSVLRNTVGYMLMNIDNQTTDGEEKSKPELIKLGLDLRARLSFGPFWGEVPNGPDGKIAFESTIGQSDQREFCLALPNGFRRR